ncbi:MAG: cupin domain-containing protein, partial [Thermoleophilia bacterium]
MRGPGGFDVVRPGEAEPIPATGIHSQTVHSDDAIRVVLFGFAAGEELTEHTASRPATIQVLSGSFDLTLGGEPVEAPAGTWVHMTAGLPHALRAREPSRLLLT